MRNGVDGLNVFEGQEQPWIQWKNELVLLGSRKSQTRLLALYLYSIRSHSRASTVTRSSAACLVSEERSARLAKPAMYSGRTAQKLSWAWFRGFHA